jgi:hypothetical protein
VNKRVFGFVAALVAVVSLVLAGCAEPASETTEYPTELIFAICTGTESADYPLQSRIASLGDEAIPASLTPVQPGGAEASLVAMLNGEVHLGNTCAATILDAYEGLGRWEGDPAPNIIRGLAMRDLFDDVTAVREDSGIESYSDLAGKTFFYGRPGSRQYRINVAAMDALGYNVEEYVSDVKEAVSAMKDRRLDAFSKTIRGERADSTHMDIMTSVPLQIISFSEEEIDTILGKYSHLTFRQQSPDAFPTMPVLGERWVATDQPPTVCTKDFPEEWAYQWVMSTVKNWDELAELLYSLEDLDPLDYPQWVEEMPTDFYLHAGAVRAYRELGATVPESIVPPEMK